jgi:hypothetical protein
MLTARNIAYGAVLALFVAWISLGSWYAWRSSLPTPQNQSKNASYQNAKKEAEKISQSESIDDRLAKYTLWVAIFTGVLAVSTIGLWVATIGLYFAGKSQLKLARDEFISSHRPKLRLKHIWVSSPDGQTFVGELQTGMPLTVRLDIVNIGNTTATINIINFITLIIPSQERLPQRPPYNEPGFLHQFQVGSFRLESGITFTQHVSDGRILAPEDIRALRDGNNRLYFVGAIGYRDDAQRPRGTAFCRYFSFYSCPAHPMDIGRFQTEYDSDYEYQD